MNWNAIRVVLTDGRHFTTREDWKPPLTGFFLWEPGKIYFECDIAYIARIIYG